MSSESVSGIQLLTRERVNQAFEKAQEEISPTKGRFVLLTEEYYDAARYFCDVCFSSYEPLSMNFGTRWNTPCAVEFWDASLVQNISVALVEEETNEIIATRLIRWEANDKTPSPLIGEDPNDPAMNKVMQFVDACEAEEKFSEHFPYKEMYNFLGLATAPKYRNHGYATQLMNFAIKFLRNLALPNCQIMRVMTTSKYSQKLFEKFGFQCIYTKMYADYKVDGERVLTNTGEHTCLKVYGSYL